MTPYRRLFTLYILRHGETGFNQLGIVQGAGVDAPLNNVGFLQAIGVGHVFRGLPRPPLWLVYCSTMKRTRESLYGFLLGYEMEDFSLGPDSEAPARDPPTASCTFSISPPVYTDFLREKAQGSREGKRNDLTLEDAERIDAEAGIDVSSKFRESDEDVKARILSFLSDLIEGQDGVGGEEGGKEGESGEVPTDDAKPDGLPPNILVVTHGGVIRVLLRDVFKVGGGPGEER